MNIQEETDEQVPITAQKWKWTITETDEAFEEEKAVAKKHDHLLHKRMKEMSDQKMYMSQKVYSNTSAA